VTNDSRVVSVTQSVLLATLAVLGLGLAGLGVLSVSLWGERAGAAPMIIMVAMVTSGLAESAIFVLLAIVAVIRPGDRRKQLASAARISAVAILLTSTAALATGAFLGAVRGDLGLVLTANAVATLFLGLVTWRSATTAARKS
jgi:hypothetical protein